MDFCGACIHYQGDEKIPNPKTTAWMDTSRPKCAIGKSAEKVNYNCQWYEPTERVKMFAAVGLGGLEEINANS